MTEDLNWLRQQHHQFDGELRRGSFFLEDCRERCDAAGLWNDTCAQDMRRRYLDPLQEEASASLNQLKIQQAAHLATASSLEGLHHEFSKTVEYSALLTRRAEEVSHLFRQIDTTLNHALSEMEESAACVSQADDLVAQASRMG